MQTPSFVDLVNNNAIWVDILSAHVHLQRTKESVLDPARHPYGRVPGLFLLRVTVPGRVEHMLRFSSYTAHRWSVIRSFVISTEYGVLRWNTLRIRQRTEMLLRL